MTTNIEARDAIDFLRQLWNYASLDAVCFTIVVVGQNVKYRHFCVNELGDYDSVFSAVEQFLSKLDASSHVYFQVLPLSAKPERGRGTARDVKVGRWLWADLDYKAVVERPEFQGCRELDDHALECFYEDGGKWIHVKRPPLSEVLKSIEEKLNLRPTIVVDSGAGYHIYFRLAYELDASRLAQLEEKIVKSLGGDPQSKDLARVLRLPGSINPRVGRKVRVIHQDTFSEIDPETPIEPERPHTDERPRARGGKLRELSDTEVLRIVELLRDAYRPGYRQFMLLYLSGWLAKSYISPISAVKIAKSLYETTQDSDPLKVRLSAVIYSYRKAGIDIDSYAHEIETLTGIRPYGLEREIEEDKVRGKTGIQEILESVLGEDRALAIIHELTDILDTLSPYRDSVIELLDYEKQLYAVANIRKLVMVRARKDGGRLVYKERIAIVAPTRVVVYENPIGGARKYEVVFEGATLRKPLVVGPALIEEVADRLRVEGLVYHTRLLNDILNAVVQAFVRRGKAEVRAEIESPGFYPIENRIVAVRYDVRQIDKGRLRQALELLNELADVWFNHVRGKFATVIKWGALAPFSYALKVRGVMQRHIFLYGDSATGKTTLGRIVLKMWGLDSRYEKTGANIDTPARLGYVLSFSTFPMLVNEPGGALMKEEIIEMIKNASDSPIARGKYIKGSYVEYPALTPLIFTSNKTYPRDDALLRRLHVITFSFGEKIPPERQREFKEKVEPRLVLLSEVGNCISNIVLESGVPTSARDALARCYNIAGLEPPAWLDLEHQDEGELETVIVEEFVERFKKMINDLYARYVSRLVEVRESGVEALTPDKVELEEKLRILLEKNMIPGVRLRGDRVFLLSTLLGEIGLEGKVSLKSLAEMLGEGFEYRNVKVDGKGLMAIITTLDDIVRVLTA